MQNSYIGDYIKLIVTSKISLEKLKRTIARYKSLSEKLGTEILAEAISQVRDEKHARTRNNLKIFAAYENDVKLIGLTKKYNITKEVAEIIISNDLMGNPNAIEIATMMYKLGITLDLAIEVCKYNAGNFVLNKLDEKYVFHKLRQIYQVKMAIEPELDFERERERIAKLLNIESIKAKYLLMCYMGNNSWGRNSTFYWNHKQFINDIDGHRSYTDKDIKFIKSYVGDPGINNFSRGFVVRDGKTIYNSKSPGKAFTTRGIIKKNRRDYFPLYTAMNKYSLPKDVVVFRGTTIESLNKYGIEQGDSEEEIKKKLNGHYQDGGFVSTSVVVETLRYLDENVNLIINLKAGTPCGVLSEHSVFEFENEVLIPPNVVFNVDDVKVIDEKIYIYLTSIPTKSISYVGSIKEKENTDDGHKQK